jgi:hypothetical protein
MKPWVSSAAAFAGMLAVNVAVASTQSYVCSPLDAQTQVAHGGTAFKLTLSADCMTLINLKDRSMEWTWKVSVRGSFGDLEGVRKFCDRPDDGMLGSPAVWRQERGRFTIFDESRDSYRFGCVGWE